MKRIIVILVFLVVFLVSSLVMAGEEASFDFASKQLYNVMRLNVFVLFAGLCLTVVFGKRSSVDSLVDVNELM